MIVAEEIFRADVWSWIMGWIMTRSWPGLSSVAEVRLQRLCYRAFAVRQTSRSTGTSKRAAGRQQRASHEQFVCTHGHQASLKRRTLCVFFNLINQNHPINHIECQVTMLISIP